MQNFYRNQARSIKKQKHYTKMLLTDIVYLIIVAEIAIIFLFFAIVSQ